MASPRKIVIERIKPFGLTLAQLLSKGREDMFIFLMKTKSYARSLQTA